MAKTKVLDNRVSAVLSIVVILAAYAGERLVEIFVAPSRSYAFSLIIGMILAVAATLLLLSKNTNAFFGLLASILGFKMLPPSINMISEVSITGEFAYFIFKKLVTLAFIYLIVRFYRLQKEEEKIRAVPIVAIMISVQFFMEISTYSYRFFVIRTGSMLGYFFASFACYALAHLTVLVLSYKANYTSLRFATYYAYMALAINALKKICAIIAMSSAGDHISRSHYVWIAVYAGIAVVYAIVKNIAKKKIA